MAFNANYPARRASDSVRATSTNMRFEIAPQFGPFGQCFVSHNDLVDEADDRAKLFERKLSSLIDYGKHSECIILNLAPFSHLTILGLGQVNVAGWLLDASWMRWPLNH